jgi:2-phospho-L-lactate transferase/gluconeogenesis factor (CofD/UPF0052 family)
MNSRELEYLKQDGTFRNQVRAGLRKKSNYTINVDRDETANNTYPKTFSTKEVTLAKKIMQNADYYLDHFITYIITNNETIDWESTDDEVRIEAENHFKKLSEELIP